ncbi:integral membrane protein, YjbE family [Thermoactinomyces sp. DSM 45891]|uniref:TerC family protein n=1 Tax=Thermoactinomyces sp. DSM 45891 TaxID=1761907 RepID=UPI0009214A65|nr:TerC family protein [Thermoactinomyces sp. DSM 45891]SFX28609.1 integral membrane protein, YjbE family [Thermoactinomyces sp. DSM 45891]
MDAQFWLSFFNIIVLDLILSGDNAVVIGMVARNLPEDKQKKAILFGAGTAIVLRATLTAIAAYVLNVPFLMSIGGLLLLWIAVKLLVEDNSEGTHVESHQDLRSAIKTIVIADVVMSLDNVLAVAGVAHGNIYLVLFGLALSIPIIMWGSRLIAKIMNQLPWLTYVGSAILGYTAGGLIIGDKLIEKYFLQGLDTFKFLIPIALAIIVILVGVLWKKVMGNHNRRMV